MTDRAAEPGLAELRDHLVTPLGLIATKLTGSCGGHSPGEPERVRWFITAFTARYVGWGSARGTHRHRRWAVRRAGRRRQRHQGGLVMMCRRRIRLGKRSRSRKCSAQSTRCWISQHPGLMPTSSVKRRAKVHTLVCECSARSARAIGACRFSRGPLAGGCRSERPSGRSWSACSTARPGQQAQSLFLGLGQELLRRLLLVYLSRLGIHGVAHDQSSRQAMPGVSGQPPGPPLNGHSLACG